MSKSYLEKYNDLNNPVLERLNLFKKMLIRIIILSICTVWFILLYALNSHNIFGDISQFLLIFVYVAMGLCALMSFVGLIIIILKLAIKNNNPLEKVPFDKKRLVYNIIDWFMVVPICICLALTIYGYIFRVQKVEGISMEPSFYGDDRVVSIYDTDNLRRGDVVIVYINPEVHKGHDEKYWIKRVIGLPGDEMVEYTREFGLKINGKMYDEPYIKNELCNTHKEFRGSFTLKKLDENGNLVTETHTTIPEGYVFVMGDNRNGSTDSRIEGLIPIEDLVGVVVLRFNGLIPEKVERGVLE